jgi:hypothetical protein
MCSQQWTCRVSPLPPPAVLDVQGLSISTSIHQYRCARCVSLYSQQNRLAGFIPFHSQECGLAVCRVCLSTASSMDVQDACLSIASNMDVQGVPFFKSLNVGLSSIQTVRYWNKGTQSRTEMLQYRTEIQDARMLIPASSSSIPQLCKYT